MEKCLIVAVADNLAIGKAGDMPWHISEDLKYFKRTTMGCPVIMGRRTFESIGSRPLPGRLNIIVSRTLEDSSNYVLTDSLEEAFQLAEDACAAGTPSGASRCFVMGGAQVYRQAMELVDRMFVTHVHASIDGADAYFPEINSDIWQVESRSELLTDPKSGYDFEFVVYQRSPDDRS